MVQLRDDGESSEKGIVNINYFDLSSLYRISIIQLYHGDDDAHKQTNKQTNKTINIYLPTGALKSGTPVTLS